MIRKVTALAHELRDDTMEAAFLEAEALLVGAERSKVFCRHRDHVGAEEYDDSTDGVAADGDVEEHRRIGAASRRRRQRPHPPFRRLGSIRLRRRRRRQRLLC